MLLEQLKTYEKKTKQILELSSPHIENISSAEDYRLIMNESFKKIGLLARENNKILSDHLYPLLEDDELLSNETISSLMKFTSLLADATNLETADSPMIWMLARKLVEVAEKKGDIKLIIKSLDTLIIATYMMVNMTQKLSPDYDYYINFRNVGYDAAKKLLAYLDKDEFIKLPDDECKEIVLINSRYIRSLFEWGKDEDVLSLNKECLPMMQKALDIAYDDFYLNAAPNYDWNYHIFRTLQYVSDLPENQNRRRFTNSQLKTILQYTEKLIDYMKDKPELAEHFPEVEQYYLLYQNQYLNKKITIEKYQKNLLSILKDVDPSDKTPRGMFMNFIIPYAYICTLNPKQLSKKEEKKITELYEGMVSYIYHMPKTGVLTFLINFLAEVLRNFIEVPNGIRFEDMCLKLIAICHPPTYVHTLSVASITEFLTNKLLDTHPELFVGELNTRSIKGVIKKKNDIANYAYKCALLHDIGKIFVVETIITYGRNLLPDEFDLIRIHGSVGSSLLANHKQTHKYASGAKGHHKWFNNKGGYPEDFDINTLKNKTILSILTCADCLDAATDIVGRSYKPGKALEDFIQELKEDKGKRYAPYLCELFKDPEVFNGLKELLTEGREENYRKTYNLLKSL